MMFIFRQQIVTMAWHVHRVSCAWWHYFWAQLCEYYMCKIEWILNFSDYIMVRLVNYHGELFSCEIAYVKSILALLNWFILIFSFIYYWFKNSQFIKSKSINAVS